MAKRASRPSAESFTRTSVSLSRAVEKNFALEAEVSRLRHHVSILSQRLNRNEKELSALRRSHEAVPHSPFDSPPSPTPSVVTVVTVGGSGVDPELPGVPTEEPPRGNVAPTVIPSSPPPFVVAVGVGGPSSDWFSGEAVALPSVAEEVEDTVAVSVAVAPTSVEVPEPRGAEPVAGGEDKRRWVATDEAVGDVGSSSVGRSPGSSAGKRRKSKKRRTRPLQDVASAPLALSESSDSSSRLPEVDLEASLRDFVPVVEGSAGIPWGIWGCTGPCRGSSDGPLIPWPRPRPCSEVADGCGGVWRVRGEGPWSTSNRRLGWSPGGR